MSTARKEREELAAIQRVADLQSVLSTPAGRRFYWRVLEQVTGVFGSSFSGTEAGTYFAEGRRSVGIALMTEAQRVASDAYVAMLMEALEAKGVEQKLADAAATKGAAD